MISDLKLLSGQETEARAAYERIAPDIRRFLLRHLGGRFRSSDTLDDVVVCTMVKLWSSRERYEYQGLERWWSFVRTAANQCAYDQYRQDGREATADWPNEDLPSEDRPLIEGLAEGVALGIIFDEADALWLGASESTSPGLNERLLAAQYFYLHGMSWQEVASMLDIPSQDVLDEWLGDEAVMKSLAYTAFYMSNAFLSDTLLATPGEWTKAEALAILLRFRNGLLTEQILRFSDCDLSPEDFEALVARCQTRFPVRKSASELRRNLPSRTSAMVGRSDVWKRLAFQYHYKDELPVKHNLERIEPASEAFSAKVTYAKMNMWLSGGRLVTQLAQAVQARRKRAAV